MSSSNNSFSSIVNSYLPEINNFFSLFRQETPNRKDNLVKRYNATALSDEDAAIAKEAMEDFIKSSSDPAATRAKLQHVQFYNYHNGTNKETGKVVKFRAPLRATGDAHFVAYPHSRPSMSFVDPETLKLLNAKEKKFLFTQQLVHYDRDHLKTRAQVGFVGPYVIYPALILASMAMRRNANFVSRFVKPMALMPVGFLVVQPLWHFGVYNSFAKFQEFEADRIAAQRLGEVFETGIKTMHKIFLAQCKRDGIEVPDELQKKIMEDDDDDDDDDDDKKDEEKKDDGDKKEMTEAKKDDDDDDDDDDDEFMDDYNFVIATTTTFPSLRRRVHKLSLLQGVKEMAEERAGGDKKE